MTDAFIHSGGDPQVGNLATPINSSPVAKAFLNSLPAYRKGLSPLGRGLEIGMAHGYFVYGPFAVFGPFRDGDLSSLGALLSAIGLISILMIALSLYVFAGVSKPEATLTTPEPPESWGTDEGWSEFSSGFFLGGCSGAIFAYFLCTAPHLSPLMDLAAKSIGGAPIPF
jgi:photosystem I subunit 11